MRQRHLADACGDAQVCNTHRHGHDGSECSNKCDDVPNKVEHSHYCIPFANITLYPFIYCHKHGKCSNWNIFHVFFFVNSKTLTNFAMFKNSCNQLRRATVFAQPFWRGFFIAQGKSHIYIYDGCLPVNFLALRSDALFLNNGESSRHPY